MDRMFTDPKTGDSIRFIKTAQETRGELLEVTVSYSPHSTRPPAHFHPHQEERFEVLEGQITVHMDNIERTYRAGENFTVSKGVHHAMWNADESPVVMNWQIRPALETQELFESLWGLQQDGKLKSSSPNLLQVAVILNRYNREICLSKPPRGIQHVLFPVLAWIGRIRGYRAHYDEYRVL